MSCETGSLPDASEVQDRQAIQSVVGTHSRGLDRLDSDLLKSCYWPDAEVDYGSYKGPAHAFCELVVAALGDSYQLTQHSLGNPLIAVDNGSARVETYCTAWHLLKEGDQELVFSGRYLDLLERRGTCWKLLQRTVVMDWSRRFRVDDERDSEAFAALKKGAHGELDPLFPFLTQP